MNTELTDNEKEFLALALQSFCMHQGPDLFPTAVRVAEKLDITKQLGQTLQSWINVSYERHMIDLQNEDRR